MDKYKILKKHFGYDSFRVGQEQIIDNLLGDRDVLGIMPTGGGKSLCFQLPELMQVINPTIIMNQSTY